jgi:hypothetical protein
MTPTTIKLEGALLASLEWALRQEQLAVAADLFARFLRESPDEAAWLDEWARSDLTTVPSKST